MKSMYVLIVWYVCILLNAICFCFYVSKNKALRKFHKKLSDDYVKMTKELQEAYLKALSDVDKTANAIRRQPDLSAWHEEMSKLSKHIYETKVKFEIQNLGVFVNDEKEN